MKKNQDNAILVDQTIRRKTIISYLSLIFILLFIGLSFLCLYLTKNKTYYVNYFEESNIDYKVFLKDNEFFNKPYLEANNQYIANLIDYINASFDYKLKVSEKNINYKYQYSIEANVNVIDKNTKNYLYQYNDVLIKDKLNYSNNLSNVQIKENIQIDYNKYNNLIKKFISIYNLEDAITTLDIVMNVTVLGDCEDIENIDKTSTISLSIPLTTKTVAIDISKNLVDTDKENFMACKEKSSIIIIYLIIALLITIIAVLTLISMIKYIIKTRTAESIYQRELQKILNNYKSYIQKINNSFDLTDYQVLQVDDFTDMLEIRDTLSQPILMTENKEKTGVYFIIPSNTKILYAYSLKVSKIKKQMKENALEKL